tara:strand:+ start:221 stop:394 length:174 start_codon:yes stop_codon:yes gene_type:complete
VIATKSVDLGFQAQTVMPVLGVNLLKAQEVQVLVVLVRRRMNVNASLIKSLGGTFHT